MEFRKLGPVEWEAARKPYDFHVRFEDGRYVVDVFNSALKDPDEAYVTSEEFDEWEDVEIYCESDLGQPDPTRIPH